MFLTPRTAKKSRIYKILDTYWHLTIEGDSVKMRENEEIELYAKCRVAREEREGGKVMGSLSFDVLIICCRASVRLKNKLSDTNLTLIVLNSP